MKNEKKEKITYDQVFNFINVAELQSIKKTRNKLDLSQGTVSTSISKLEKIAGEKLFIRHQSGLELTTQGHRFYKVAKEVVYKFEELGELFDTDKKVSGDVRISTWYGIAAFLLADAVPPFMAEFGDIFLDLVGDNIDRRFEDYNCDIAIRTEMKGRKDLIQTYLLSMYFNMYASQAYLDKFGTPETFSDLDHHRLLSASYLDAERMYFADWHLFAGIEGEKMRKPYASMNSSIGLAKCCAAGLGIATFPDYYTKSVSEPLVRLFPAAVAPEMKFFLIYPEVSKSAKRIQVVENFLMKFFTDHRF